MPQDGSTAPESGASFVEVLQQIGNGTLVAEVTDATQELVRALMERERNAGGKPSGKLTISLSFKLDRGIIEVEPDFKVTMPKSIRGRALLYGTPDGRLTQNDPRQFGLELAPKDVATQAATTVRSIATR